MQLSIYLIIILTLSVCLCARVFSVVLFHFIHFVQFNVYVVYVYMLINLNWFQMFAQSAEAMNTKPKQKNLYNLM